MEDVLQHYGYAPRRSGRIPCPLHNGKDNNFSYKQGYFKCFVCGEHGSVIDFVMKLFGISYPQAIIRLDADFNLGITGEKPMPAQQSKAFLERQEAQRQEAQRRADYYAAAAEHQYWHEIQLWFRPTREEWEVGYVHPLYLEAVKHLPPLEHFLDENLGR